MLFWRRLQRRGPRSEQRAGQTGYKIIRSNVFKAWILSVSIFIFFGIMLCLAVAAAIEVTDAEDQTVIITSSERIVSLNEGCEVLPDGDGLMRHQGSPESTPWKGFVPGTLGNLYGGPFGTPA